MIGAMPTLLAMLLLSPSPIIYPAQTLPLRFSHAGHADQATCVECHPKAKTSARPGDLLLPDEASCLRCHEAFEEDADGAREANCDLCHPGYKPSLPAGVEDTRRARPWPPLAQIPAAQLRFSHRAHLDRAECETCHQGVEAAGLATTAHLPTMADCLSCHDGAKAPNRCDTCHLIRPDGRLKTRFPEGQLMPTGRLGADDHRGDWARRHGPTAAADPARCETCHSPPDCAGCHASRIRPLELHPADWLRTHAPAARRNDPACGRCHQRQTFCVDCHQLSGLSPAPGALTFGADHATPQRLHPPGFVARDGTPPGPNHHRAAARRNLRECVSCHQEDDCVRCHSAQATARLQANPHPPGYARRCARALDANDRGCLKCHSDRADLERRCR